MSVQRIKISMNKKIAILKHQKREIAGLLQENKDEKARIKVEHIIREDFLIESLEYLELLCELIHERVNYIKSQKDCPADLVEAVSSLIWATDRVEIPELKEVQKQLIKKYGSEFGKEAKEGQHVNERLLAKLSVANPTALLVTRYLEEIAKEYKVQWTPTDRGMPNSLDEAFPTPQGFSIPMAPGTELRSAYQRQQNMGGPSSFANYAAPTTLSTEPEYYPPGMMNPQPGLPPSYDDSMKAYGYSGAPYAPHPNTAPNGFPAYNPAQPGFQPHATAPNAQPFYDGSSSILPHPPMNIPEAPSGGQDNLKGGDPPADDDGSFEALAARFASLQKGNE